MRHAELQRGHRPGNSNCNTWTDIVRHTLVKGGSSPDDPALAGYWAQRRQKVRPPLDSYTVRLLSRQDGRCSLCGENLLTPDQPPQSPRAGNAGSCRSSGGRSRRTTCSTTTRPLPHAASEHTSYTPPATGADIRPGRPETPWCSRRPESPQRLAWAACAETCTRGPEGASVQQCTGATRPSAGPSARPRFQCTAMQDAVHNEANRAASWPSGI